MYVNLPSQWGYIICTDIFASWGTAEINCDCRNWTSDTISTPAFRSTWGPRPERCTVVQGRGHARIKTIAYRRRDSSANTYHWCHRAHYQLFILLPTVGPTTRGRKNNTPQYITMDVSSLPSRSGAADANTGDTPKVDNEDHSGRSHATDKSHALSVHFSHADAPASGPDYVCYLSHCDVSVLPSKKTDMHGNSNDARRKPTGASSSDAPSPCPLVDLLILRDDIDIAPMHGQPFVYRILIGERVKDKDSEEASCSDGSGHAYLKTLTTRESAQASSVAQGSGLVPPLPIKRG